MFLIERGIRFFEDKRAVNAGKKERNGTKGRKMVENPHKKQKEQKFFLSYYSFVWAVMMVMLKKNERKGVRTVAAETPPSLQPQEGI